MREPKQSVAGSDVLMLPCPACESAALVGRHCKRLCPICGYVESCEDNFLPNQQNPTEHDSAGPGCGGLDRA